MWSKKIFKYVTVVKAEQLQCFKSREEEAAALMSEKSAVLQFWG